MTANATSLRDECEELARRYPLAVRRNAGGLRFLAISYRDRFYRLVFATRVTNLLGWDSQVRFDIEPDTTDAPEWVLQVLRQGTPVPRHDDMFGWIPRGAVSVAGVFMFYTDPTEDNPEPNYNLSMNSGVATDQLPEFRGRRIGQWFWNLVASGELVLLNPLIARSPDTFFLVDALGVTFFEVTADLSSPQEGETPAFVVPRGRYPGYQRIEQGVVIPPLGGRGFPVKSRIDLAATFAENGSAS